MRKFVALAPTTVKLLAQSLEKTAFIEVTPFTAVHRFCSSHGENTPSASPDPTDPHDASNFTAIRSDDGGDPLISFFTTILFSAEDVIVVTDEKALWTYTITFRIDPALYKLFSLTEEEIAIIEGVSHG